MGQSRLVIASVVVTLSFIVPAILCAAVAAMNLTTVLDLSFLCVAAAVWMAVVVLVNWWEFTSVWLRWAWTLALVAALAQRIRAAHGLPLFSTVGPVTVATAIIGAIGIWILVGALHARRHDGDAIDLAFPLTAGRFLVTDGGDGARSFFVNYHYGFGQHRASGANVSMRYAMDVVEIGPSGIESSGFLPRRNAAYRIWEKPLHAPCDGRVVHAIGDVADNSTFGPNRPYGVGNHVVIRTGRDVYVVLGHMRERSVTVGSGDDVRAGDRIGCVGNSGWTERPHLHMQAMRSENNDWWHGAPLPMRFDGRFLVRNQMLRR
jgi:murein DD-endopeptidase MepM/ murein hydrolase activator NlpD